MNYVGVFLRKRSVEKQRNPQRREKRGALGVFRQQRSLDQDRDVQGLTRAHLSMIDEVNELTLNEIKTENEEDVFTYLLCTRFK